VKGSVPAVLAAGALVVGAVACADGVGDGVGAGVEPAGALFAGGVVFGGVNGWVGAEGVGAEGVVAAGVLVVGALVDGVLIVGDVVVCVADAVPGDGVGAGVANCCSPYWSCAGVSASATLAPASAAVARTSVAVMRALIENPFCTAPSSFPPSGDFIHRSPEQRKPRRPVPTPTFGQVPALRASSARC
jgi:hypothetical protein